MSVKDHHRFVSFCPDPFVCPQFDVGEEGYSTAWSSSLSDSTRFCPSSGSSSPDSFVFSPTNLPHLDLIQIKEEPYFFENFCHFNQQSRGFSPVKQEPLEDPFYPVFLERLSSTESIDDFVSCSSEYTEPSLDERYEDFVELMCEKPSVFGYREVELKMETADSKQDLPEGSQDGKRSRKSKRPRKSSCSPPASQASSQAPLSPSTSSDFSASGDGSVSSSSGNSVSGDETSPTKSRKRRTPGSKSPASDRSSECNSTSYLRRREKNNIAVRKSREKKRQEIKRFADEHTKLRREVEDVRSQNDKLISLLTRVEEGLLNEGMSREELSGLVASAKRHVNSL